MKYFLTALTIPEQDLWVNLSPYEKGRTIESSLGNTLMGRDLLAEDYILKQLTASVIYPEDALGKKFWSQVYKQAADKLGTTQIPVNTFNKVWIVPSEAVVWEHDGKVMIVKSRLKVMLEEDYLAMNKNIVGVGSKPTHMRAGLEPAPTDTNQIIRDIVLPVLEQQVNEGEHFAQLRQMFQAMILATWYKKTLKESIISKVYSNQKKIKGVDDINKSEIEAIYQQYLLAFKKGAFNYIKEDFDLTTGKTTPRKYFSGGFTALVLGGLLTILTMATPPSALAQSTGNTFQATWQITEAIAEGNKRFDKAMRSNELFDFAMFSPVGIAAYQQWTSKAAAIPSSQMTLGVVFTQADMMRWGNEHPVAWSSIILGTALVGVVSYVLLRKKIHNLLPRWLRDFSNEYDEGDVNIELPASLKRFPPLISPPIRIIKSKKEWIEDLRSNDIKERSSAANDLIKVYNWNPQTLQEKVFFALAEQNWYRLKQLTQEGAQQILLDELKAAEQRGDYSFYNDLVTVLGFLGQKNLSYYIGANPKGKLARMDLKVPDQDQAMSVDQTLHLPNRQRVVRGGKGESERKVNVLVRMLKDLHVNQNVIDKISDNQGQYAVDIEEKISFLREAGVDVVAAINKSPEFLKTSLGKIRGIVALLVASNVQGFAEGIGSYPTVLNLSIENKIRPTIAIIKAINPSETLLWSELAELLYQNVRVLQLIIEVSGRKAKRIDNVASLRTFYVMINDSSERTYNKSLAEWIKETKDDRVEVVEGSIRDFIGKEIDRRSGDRAMVGEVFFDQKTRTLKDSQGQAFERVGSFYGGINSIFKMGNGIARRVRHSKKDEFTLDRIKFLRESGEQEIIQEVFSTESGRTTEGHPFLDVSFMEGKNFDELAITPNRPLTSDEIDAVKGLLKRMIDYGKYIVQFSMPNVVYGYKENDPAKKMLALLVDLDSLKDVQMSRKELIDFYLEAYTHYEWDNYDLEGKIKTFLEGLRDEAMTGEDGKRVGQDQAMLNSEQIIQRRKILASNVQFLDSKLKELAQGTSWAIQVNKQGLIEGISQATQSNNDEMVLEVSSKGRLNLKSIYVKGRIQVSEIISESVFIYNESRVKKIITSPRLPKPVGPYSHAVRFENMVFTSGIGARNPQTSTLLAMNFVDQARQVLTSIRNIIEDSGSSMDKVRRMNIFLTDMNDKPVVEGILKEFFGDQSDLKPVFIKVEKLPVEGMQIEIEAVGTLDDQELNEERLVSIPAQSVSQGDITEQARQVLEKLKASLVAAGSSLDQVVKVKVRLRNMSDFKAMNAVYTQFFDAANSPARSAMEVANLSEGSLVEIEAIGIKDQAMMFNVKGINGSETIRQLKELAGRSIIEIERLARPGGISVQGFLGKDESFLDVLVNDNDFVLSKGLTHQELAQALAGVVKTKKFNGVDYDVEESTYRGSQQSLFNDGVSTNVDYIVTRKNDYKRIEFSGMLIDYISRYGFYEGKGTSYRLGPQDIIEMFFLNGKSLETKINVVAAVNTGESIIPMESVSPVKLELLDQQPKEAGDLIVNIKRIFDWLKYQPNGVSEGQSFLLGKNNIIVRKITPMRGVFRDFNGNSTSSIRYLLKNSSDQTIEMDLDDLSREIASGQLSPKIQSFFFDKALVTPGGIDLNANHFDIQIKRDGNGIPLPNSQQSFESINIQGFEPTIIEIKPVDLPALLGLAK